MVPATEDPQNRLVQLKWFPYASISQSIALDALPRALIFISHGQGASDTDSLEIAYQVNGGKKYVLKTFRMGTDPLQHVYLSFPPETRSTQGTLIFDKIDIIDDRGR
jgi:hypothetical protein